MKERPRWGSELKWEGMDPECMWEICPQTNEEHGFF